jgi:uncharacterized protein
MKIMTKMNPVVHFEMRAEDTRMAVFYQEAFGWKAQMLGPEMGEYVVVTTAESDAKPGAPAGAINGGFKRGEIVGTWHCVTGKLH